MLGIKSPTCKPLGLRETSAVSLEKPSTISHEEGNVKETKPVFEYFRIESGFFEITGVICVCGKTLGTFWYGIFLLLGKIQRRKNPIKTMNRSMPKKMSFFTTFSISEYEKAVKFKKIPNVRKN